MKIRKFSITVVLILIISLFFSYSSNRENIAGTVNAPFFRMKQISSSSGIRIKSWFSFWSSISNLRKENKELEEKIIGLEVDRSRIAELEYENVLLKKELGYAETHKENILIPAHIIGREPTSFLDSVIIDKGAQDGVKKESAVISGGALIGQVSEVYENQSKIVLITSKDSIILSMLQESRAKGILRGGISGILLEDITQDIDFKTGEYVVTSGLDGVIPSGIPIGKTGGIRSYSSGLFKNIAVEPISDLSKLEIVFIMK